MKRSLLVAVALGVALGAWLLFGLADAVCLVRMGTLCETYSNMLAF